jgi:hypothetical protein
MISGVGGLEAGKGTEPDAAASVPTGGICGETTETGRARVGIDVRWRSEVGPDGEQCLVDEADDLVTTVAEGHGRAIDVGPPALKDGWAMTRFGGRFAHARW